MPSSKRKKVMPLSGNKVKEQIVRSVARETKLSYSQSIVCIVAALCAFRDATKQYGQVDFNMFGLDGVSARTAPDKEWKRGAWDDQHPTPRT